MGLLKMASATAVAAGLASSMLPPYPAGSPQRVNPEYLLDADPGVAEWLVKPDSGLLPTALASTATFRRDLGGCCRLTATWTADAARLDLAVPGLKVISAAAEGHGARYRIHLQSMRGASSISLCWLMDRAPTTLEVQEPLLLEPDARMLIDLDLGHRQTGYRCISEHGLSERGIKLSFVVPTRSPFDVLLSDRREGLPDVNMTRHSQDLSIKQRH